jgi:hypothetical protein
MNSRVLIVAAGLAYMSIVPAGAWVRLPATSPIVEVDWQSPETLPRRFRNHCAYDSFSGRGYCSDHCGFEYQFYYCSPESFGCCHVGFGYCDWNGLLRCHP